MRRIIRAVGHISRLNYCEVVDLKAWPQSIVLKYFSLHSVMQRQTWLMQSTALIA